jgi:hypothetical protein
MWYSINVTGTAVPLADEGDQNKTQSEKQFANASKQKKGRWKAHNKQRQITKA